MYKFALLLLLPFFATTFHPDRTILPPEEEITWSGDRRLSWDDFKGIPSGGGFTGATTYSTIKATPKVEGYFNSRVAVEVKAVFRCDKSWAKEKAKESAYLLNHEQRHFDIAEMYARKIKQALAPYRITPRNYDQIKAEVIEQLFQEYVDYDKAYDHETVHGLKAGVQREWDERIDEALGLVTDLE